MYKVILVQIGNYDLANNCFLSSHKVKLAKIQF